MRSIIRYITIAIGASALTITVLNCANTVERPRPAVPSQIQTAAATTAIDFASIRAFSPGFCKVADAKKTVGASATASRLVMVRGGGWEHEDADKPLEGFAKYIPTSGYTAVVLSATSTTGNYNSSYFFKYYRQGIPNVRMAAIYTSSAAQANAEGVVKSVSGANAIIITGGFADRLRHISGTLLGEAIRTAYANGVPIYTNSASTALVGPYFGWDLSKVLGSGLGLLSASFLSHLEDPAKYKQKTDDLSYLVPGKLSQSFGLTAGTLATVADNVLTVSGTDSARHMVFVYDKSLPSTDECRTWVLFPGESYLIQ